MSINPIDRFFVIFMSIVIEAMPFIIIGAVISGMLEELLAQLAVGEKREVQILDRRGQAPDHPVAATCLESNYLKCLICRVR